MANNDNVQLKKSRCEFIFTPFLLRNYGIKTGNTNNNNKTKDTFVTNQKVMEQIWYKHLDWSVIWACFGAVVVLILFLEKNRGKDILKAQEEKGVLNYFFPTYLNYIFHFISAFVMLSFVSEIAVPFFDWMIQKATLLFGFETDFKIKSSDDIAHFMAVVSGLSGGYVLAKAIKTIQKIK